VFQALGYSVENTDGPGDGGTDLVATGKGRRICVQAKGYPSGRTVGTDAVQQAHLGKDARRCDVAIVITNSILTAQARYWARMVGCVVIERDGIRDLVLGRRF
jgi:HJR/Mrr/RecB family endonuclease